jgi:CDP-diglyceride synthetase
LNESHVFLKRERNLVIRLLTGFIGAPIVFYILWSGGLPFVALISGVVLLALWEFWQMVRADKYAVPLMIFGVFYICVPLALCVWLRVGSDRGFLWVFALLMANWATDTGAYAGGRLFGRHKLAPQLSPNKTVEGAIVGWLTGTIIGILIFALAGMLDARTIILPMIVGVSVVFGDLFESALKRRYAVKDSGGILPGHGGILDRIDGTLIAAVTSVLFLLATGGF